MLNFEMNSVKMISNLLDLYFFLRLSVSVSFTEIIFIVTFHW